MAEPVLSSSEPKALSPRYDLIGRKFSAQGTASPRATGFELHTPFNWLEYYGSKAHPQRLRATASLEFRALARYI
ncbi:hypothetical protein SKAU_G00016250 [Synaphobranchus kaupii]|uniref:Uncharacterized protein n=1 Tax=Synaphobranchus kaupii TaxID=118154 RepID=A0A9Q1JDV0_SYNKA|nr:hypothetical protein SKAU_G00016250 [Synaphobranchus kaupii]